MPYAIVRFRTSSVRALGKFAIDHFGETGERRSPAASSGRWLVSDLFLDVVERLALRHQAFDLCSLGVRAGQPLFDIRLGLHISVT